MNKRTEALIIYGLIYLITATLSGLSLKYLFNTGNSLLDLFLADLLGAFIIYINCIIFDSISIYDPYWTVEASCISFFHLVNLLRNNQSLSLADGSTIRTLIVFILVNFWSIRLTSNLFINGIHDVKHEDWRYSQYRDKLSLKYLYFLFSIISFILIPTVLVYFGSLPLYYVFKSTKELNLKDFLAIFITTVAIIIEWLADHQLRQETIKNRNKQLCFVMDKGLWSLCRHPNYFGEITFWFGLFLFSLSAGAKFNYYLLIGPVGVFIIIYFGSLPMMEKRQLTRRKDLYTAYMKQVPYKIFPLNFRSVLKRD